MLSKLRFWKCFQADCARHLSKHNESSQYVQLKAVIFDWAGTIADHGVFAPVVAFTELFRRTGVAITEEEARRPMGAHKYVHIKKIVEEERVQMQWKAVHGSAPSDDDIETLYSNYIPIQLECLKNHCSLIDGVVSTVDILRKDHQLKVGTTTGFTRPILDELIKASAASGFVADCNVAADEVPRARPCPYMVWLNAIKLDVSPIHSIVKVDDTVDGILEGLSAGAWTVGIVRSGNYVCATVDELEALPSEVVERRVEMARNMLRDAGAHYVVDDITQLPSIVEDINCRLAAGEKP